nr:integrase domain-containing protein [Serratia quinivorans]
MAVQLSCYLGLWSTDTVQSAESLKTWRQVLINGDVRVWGGMEGGRHCNVVNHHVSHGMSQEDAEVTCSNF